MKHLATTLLLLISVLGARPSTAAPLASPFHRGMARMGGTITVPPEWAGIWAISDTIYDCTGAFQSASTVTDTLCAGASFQQDSTITCTGSATSTTYQQTCDGGGEVFTDCAYTFHLDAHGTRNGENYFSVTTITTTYSGTGKGCDLFPDNCTQINTHATRTGPAPTVYCSTPVRSSTWGQLKALYR
jgi:hypothetical protein